MQVVQRQAFMVDRARQPLQPSLWAARFWRARGWRLIHVGPGFAGDAAPPVVLFRQKRLKRLRRGT